jgi:2-polyprenyl-6-methoxyphenol hydroxylase-like FAD-dependent oxidoreductase
MIHLCSVFASCALTRLVLCLAGDAAHPMTPNLGQGGCVALEDAVVLARELSKVASTRENFSQEGSDSHGTSRGLILDPGAIDGALRSYERLRIPRAAKLTVQSWVYGTLLQIGFPPVTFARDNVVVPYLFKPDHWLDHTLYDCGELPTR